MWTWPSGAAPCPANCGPAAGDQLLELHRAGVSGFKCFLLDSGVEEFPPLDRAGVTAAMRRIAAFGGLLIAHAEDPAVIAAAPEPAGRSYRSFVASRPPEAETEAIGWFLDAARQTGCRGAPGAPVQRRRAAADRRRPGPRACRSRSRPARTTSP